MWNCFLLLALGLQAPLIAPEDGATSLRPGYTIALKDWLLTIQARKVLWEDRELGPMNLAIVIDSGVGSLYGAVPSQYFQERAEAAVMQVRGVVFVHNRLRVQYPERGAEPRVRQFPPVDEAGTGLPGRQ